MTAILVITTFKILMNSNFKGLDSIQLVAINNIKKNKLKVRNK